MKTSIKGSFVVLALLLTAPAPINPRVFQAAAEHRKPTKPEAVAALQNALRSVEQAKKDLAAATFFKASLESAKRANATLNQALKEIEIAKGDLEKSEEDKK